jgi:hypothetical protein
MRGCKELTSNGSGSRSAPTSCAAVFVSSRDGSATLYALKFIAAKKVKLIRAAHLQVTPPLKNLRKLQEQSLLFLML